MYFRVNLKMKKPTLCCFTWIVFIELNLTVAFLLIRKTWDDGFVGKVGGWEILRNGEDPSNGGDFEMGLGEVDTPLRTMSILTFCLCIVIAINCRTVYHGFNFFS